MALDTELLEITKDNLAEAQFMASNFIDKAVQNRIFFNVAGAEAVISYLEKFEIDVNRIASIHSIKRVVEKIDIADVILDNIHIDVRVVFNENEIFIPKSHFTLGIVPDIYAVLKYDKSFQRINFIGFFEASAINLNYHNEDYYFMEPDKLQSPFDMLDFIKNFKGNTEKKLTDAQFLKGRELSIAVADHDVTNEEFNEFLALLVKSLELRGLVLEYDNFETLASKVAFALQVSKTNRKEQIETVDMDDFMNMPDENFDNEESNKKPHESKNFDEEDANGDSLLDDDSEVSAEIAGAAAGAVIAGGSATGLSAQAASNEAIELASIAGDITDTVSDVVSEDDVSVIDDSSSNIADINLEVSDFATDSEDNLSDEVFDETIEIEDVQADEIQPVENESETTLPDDIISADGEENSSLNTDEIPDLFDEDLSDFPDLTLSEGELVSENIIEAEQTVDKESDTDLNDIAVEAAESETMSHSSSEYTEEMSDKESDLSIESDNIDSEENQELGAENLDSDVKPDDFEDDLSEDLDDFITEEPSEPSETDALSGINSEFADDEDEVSENLVANQIVSDDTAAETVKEEQDFSSFDAGDSLDIKDEDFSDIFEDDENNNDIDFGDSTDIPAEEIKQNDDNTSESFETDFSAYTNDESEQDLKEMPDESLSSFEDDNSVEDKQVEDDLTVNESIGDELGDISLESLDIDENMSDALDEDLTTDDSPSEVMKTEESSTEEPMSEQDEKSGESFDDDTESVDDELIFSDENEHVPPEEDSDKELFTGEMESFAAPSEEFIRSVSSDLPENEENLVNPDGFDDASAVSVAAVENIKAADDYGLVNFSDFADTQAVTPENEEISFADIDDFASFETISPLDEQNSEVDFVDEEAGIVIADTNIVKENSFVISDKNHNPGEIFIDINKDPSKVDISGSNEHLEELYNKGNALSDDSGLNNDVRVVGDKGKSIPLALGVGGIALVVLLAGIIIFSVSKFMNPQQDEGDSLVMNNNNNEQNLNNNLGTDVPNINPDSGNVVMNNNSPQASVPQKHEGTANSQPNVPAAASQPSKPIPATSFLSVKKLSWEVPDYVSTDASFRQYFQSAGKSLRASLSSDLLLATDYTYSDQIRLSILFSNDGTFKQARVLLSSGSSQVDNIVLQSVNQTLKVLKAPNSLGNDQSTTVILKIYL